MANFSLKLNSDFDGAIADFKQLEKVSELTRAKIEKFTKGFTTEKLDKFIAKNKLNAAAIKATKGPMAALQSETKGLQREIQRLIKSGLSPESAHIKRLVKDFKKLQAQTDQTTKRTSRFGDIIKGILGADLIRTGLSLVARGFRGIVTEAAKFEDSMAQFTTMLGGSSTAARTLVDQLQVLGAQTPFEFQDLADATQMMIGFGAATAENATEKLRMLGDVAQGSAAKLKSITLAFSQIQASGKASMQDINQLTNAGVPILKQLAKQWGLTGAGAIGEARRMATAGRATGAEVERAFQEMTAEGGMFYEGMIRSSRTFTGVLSTFTDNIKMVATGIGTQLLPYIKEALIYASKIAGKILEWVTANKELISSGIGAVFSVIATSLKAIWEVMPVLVPAFAAYGVVVGALAVKKYALAAANAVYALSATAAATGTGILTVAFNALTVAMSLNPVGLIIAAIVALIAIGYLLIKNWDSVKAKMSSVFDSIASAAEIAWANVKYGFLVAAKAIIEAVMMIYKPFVWVVDKIIGAFNRLTGKNIPLLGTSMRNFTAGMDTSINNARGNITRLERDRAASQAAATAGDAAQAASTATANAQQNASDRDRTRTVRSGHAERSQSFKQMLEAMAISEQAQQGQQIEEAQEFFTARAELEGEDFASRIEFLQEQHALIAEMDNLSAQQQIAVAQGVTRAIEKEQRNRFLAYANYAKNQVGAVSGMVADLQTVFRNSGNESRKLALTFKGLAMAQAGIASLLAFAEVLHAPHLVAMYPANIVAAGITLAAGLAKQAAIQTTPIPSGQTGLDYTVPDTPAMRHDGAAVRASAGEQVSITPRGESGGGDTSINIDIGEDNLFRIIQRGITTGRIDVSERNIGSGVFAT